MKRFAIAACFLAASAAAQPRLDPDASTRAYLDRLSPEEKARSDAYFEGGYWMNLSAFLYGLGVAWLLLSTGLSRRIRDFAAERSRRRALRTAIYAFAYIVLTTFLTFPLTLYDGFFREHRYGLSNQTFGPWLKDRAIGLAVVLVVLVPLLVLLYAVLRRAPRTWWLWCAVTSFLAFNVVVLAAPVYIMPLFNEYRALSDTELRDEILRMARASGVPADEVYQFDASRQSKRISANVSGIAGTTRISLNDNLLNGTSPPEIRAVMAHEMGHYVLNHPLWLPLAIALVLGLGYWAVNRLFGRFQRRHGERWGVRDLADPAGLPLALAIFSVVMLLLSPVRNTIVRVAENQADAFGLDAAREPHGFASVSMRLARYRKIEPGAVEEIIFYDHPSGRARVERAMRWLAEHPPGG